MERQGANTESGGAAARERGNPHPRITRNNSSPDLGGRKYIYSTIPQPLDFVAPPDTDMTEVFQTVMDVDQLKIEEVCLAIDSGTVPQNLMAKLTKPFYVRSLMDGSDEGMRYFLIMRSAASHSTSRRLSTQAGAPRAAGPSGGGGAAPTMKNRAGLSPLAAVDGVHEKQKEAKKPMFLKKLAFEISLSYNRLRYNTWDEIFFPDGSSTGIILGQLPGPEHVQELVRKHNVQAVVSCVENFELQRFDINFRGVGLKHKVLNAVDFSALDVAMLEEGVHFIRSFFGMRPRSVAPPRTDRKVYVHCKAGRSRSATIVIGFLLSLSKHPEWGLFNPLTAFRLVQAFRSHVSIGKGKFLEIHYFYLRSKVRAGFFLADTKSSTTHRWLHKAVDICDSAKESIKGYRREREKLIKLVDDVKRGKVMILGDAVPKQKSIVASLKTQMDGYLERYARHCSDDHFRKGSKFELKLRDFFLHYNPDKILAISGLVRQFSETQLVEMIKADYNYDLDPAPLAVPAVGSDGELSGEAESVEEQSGPPPPPPASSTSAHEQLDAPSESDGHGDFDRQWSTEIDDDGLS